MKTRLYEDFASAVSKVRPRPKVSVQDAQPGATKGHSSAEAPEVRTGFGFHVTILLTTDTVAHIIQSERVRYETRGPFHAGETITVLPDLPNPNQKTAYSYMDFDSLDKGDVAGRWEFSNKDSEKLVFLFGLNMERLHQVSRNVIDDFNNQTMHKGSMISRKPTDLIRWWNDNRRKWGVNL